MSNKTYNGWTNYETWRINLEFFDGLENDFWENQDAESLRDMMDEYLIENTQEGLARDYALAFVNNVNYHEILKNHQDEYDIDSAV